jgi:hypothetical protein
LFIIGRVAAESRYFCRALTRRYNRP